MAEATATEEEVLQFKWGKMRAKGGKKKDIQFYASFTFDEVEYSMFDSVYLDSGGETEPHIGKIIKIWETRDKQRKIKVLWYFRPTEIVKFLQGIQIRRNELFLASGDGDGLANVNPVEAIAGKCNVVCISKDARNPQPSDEAIQRADFVFHRFFDVGERKVVDEIGDNICGVEVKNIFNKPDSKEAAAAVKPDLDMKEANGN